jgi:hypothetical protein
MRYIFRVIGIVVAVAASLTTSCRSSAPLQSRRISVGGTVLEIPDPAGFRPITPEMAPLFESAQQGVPAGNKEFFCYIAESEIRKARKGEWPAAERKFRLEFRGHVTFLRPELSMVSPRSARIPWSISGTRDGASDSRKLVRHGSTKDALYSLFLGLLFSGAGVPL